jgi:membrane associated rhomboid family serine protease
MAAVSSELLKRILEACEQSPPRPLYPAAFARESGLERDILDRSLDELRGRGLVQLTDWMPEHGQGYTLTPAGAEVLHRQADPRRQPPARPEAPPRDAPADREEQIRRAFMTPRSPFVTWALVGANVAMFLFGLYWAGEKYGASANDYLVDPTPQVLFTLYELGALAPELTRQNHDWWRLVSYAFLHIGILHVALNMYFLYVLGPLIETMWGRLRFLAIYMVAALTGGCFVMWTQRGGVTAGASGALTGMAVSMAIWLYLNRDALNPMAYASLMRSIVTNLILIALVSLMPQVSWEGHLGGAVGGALVAYPLQLSRFADTWPARLLGYAATLLVPAVFLAVTIWHASLPQ